MAALCSLSLAVALTSSLSPAQASKAKPLDGPETEQLIDKLGHQPELLNPGYLRYVIGRPANDSTTGAWMTSKHYIWYQKNQQGLHYELFQESPQPGAVTEATFIFYLTDLDMDLEDVEHKFGLAQKKFYDQRSCPTEEYSFVPATVVRFTQPHHSRRVCRVAINYKGAALPPPPVADVEAARLARRAKALEHIKNENWRESMPLLMEHIAEHPQDMEARVALAQAYQSMSNLNGAIDQYKFALANANGDQAVIAQCTKGLQDLRVLPSVEADTQELHHEFKLQKDCEGFRAGDVQSRGQQLAQGNQAAGANPAAGSGMSLPPAYGQAPSVAGQPGDLRPYDDHSAAPGQTAGQGFSQSAGQSYGQAPVYTSAPVSAGPASSPFGPTGLDPNF